MSLVWYLEICENAYHIGIKLKGVSMVSKCPHCGAGEAAEALELGEAGHLFFEYKNKAYIIDAGHGYCIRIPKIDFKKSGWRGNKTIAGPFETFEEMAAATAIDGKSLADIANMITNGFYEG